MKIIRREGLPMARASHCLLGLCLVLVAACQPTQTSADGPASGADLTVLAAHDLQLSPPDQTAASVDAAMAVDATFASPDACCQSQPPDPVALLSGLASPQYLAVDSTNVYVALYGASYTDVEHTNSEVIRCNKNGCGNMPAIIQPPGIDFTPSGLAISTGTSPLLVWGNSNYAPIVNVTASSFTFGFDCLTSGCTSPGELMNGTLPVSGSGNGASCGNTSSFALSGSVAFLTSDCGPGGSLLVAVPLPRGTVTQIARLESLSGSIAADAKNVYWATPDDPATKKPAIEVCPLAGCASSVNYGYGAQFVTGLANTPGGISTDGVNVYWVDSIAGQVLTCPATGCANQPTVLAGGQGSPGSTALDSANVYWTNFKSGQVMRCALAGCNGKPEVLAQNQSGPSALALDASSVFWINGGAANGSVMRVPK